MRQKRAYLGTLKNIPRHGVLRLVSEFKAHISLSVRRYDENVCKNDPPRKREKDIYIYIYIYIFIYIYLYIYIPRKLEAEGGNEGY